MISYLRCWFNVLSISDVLQPGSTLECIVNLVFDSQLQPCVNKNAFLDLERFKQIDMDICRIDGAFRASRHKVRPRVDSEDKGIPITFLNFWFFFTNG